MPVLSGHVSVLVSLSTSNTSQAGPISRTPSQDSAIEGRVFSSHDPRCAERSQRRPVNWTAEQSCCRTAAKTVPAETTNTERRSSQRVKTTCVEQMSMWQRSGCEGNVWKSCDMGHEIRIISASPQSRDLAYLPLFHRTTTT